VCTDQETQRTQCEGAQLNFGFHQQTINKRNAVKTELTRHTEKPTAAGLGRLSSVSQVKTTKLGKEQPRSDPRFVRFVFVSFSASRQYIDRRSANQIFPSCKKIEEHQQPVN